MRKPRSKKVWLAASLAAFICFTLEGCIFPRNFTERNRQKNKKEKYDKKKKPQRYEYESGKGRRTSQATAETIIILQYDRDQHPA